MAYIKPIENKDKSTSYKAIIRYKGIFLTKTFPVKGNNKATVKRNAELWALEVENSIDNGTYKQEHKKHNYTVKEAIEKYIKDGNPKKSEEVRKKYITALNWFKDEIGSLSIKTLDRSDLKRCRNKLQTKKKEIPIKGGGTRLTNDLISNSSINRYLSYFSTFLSYCVDEYEIIKTNPMIGAKLKLTENEPRKRWLSELKERQELLDTCQQHSKELYLITLIALTTGARKSEILKLTWKNTDLENKALYFLDTKNGEDRTVAIPSILFDELKAYKEQNKVRHLKNDYLFASPNNKPYDYLIDKVFPQMVNKAGMEKITFHGLRHTYTSIGALLGVNTDIMDKITGHKNGRMTARYTHSDCESLRKPMNLIANYMFGIKEAKGIENAN